MACSIRTIWCTVTFRISNCSLESVKSNEYNRIFVVQILQKISRGKHSFMDLMTEMTLSRKQNSLLFSVLLLWFLSDLKVMHIKLKLWFWQFQNVQSRFSSVRTSQNIAPYRKILSVTFWPIKYETFDTQ